MFKYLIAAAALVAPTAANAQTVVITLERHSLIKEAAKTICRAAMDRKGDVRQILAAESRYLDLNNSEALYLVNLCILYAQGRVDAR